MWLFVFMVYSAHLIEVDALHDKTLLLVGLGAGVFSLGGAAGYLLPRQVYELRIKAGTAAVTAPRSTSLVKVVFALGCFIGMLLIVHHTFAQGAGSVGGSVLARARAAGVEAQNDEAGGFSFLAYIPALSIYTAILFMVERRDRWFWFVACTAFITAVFTTGRGPILMLFSALSAVYLIQENRLKLSAALRFARLPIIAFALLYVALTFTNKDTSGISGGVAGVILYFVVGYIVGPVAALDYVLQNPGQYADQPQHTFKLFLAIASRLHLTQYTPPPFLDKFVDVPFPTNVYTGYKFFYTDFGFIGCLAVVAVIGFLHAVLYRKALTESKLGLYCFAYTIFPAMMFVFDDRYSAFGEAINLFVLGCLYLALRPLIVFPGKLRMIRPPMARLRPALLSKDGSRWMPYLRLNK